VESDDPIVLNLGLSPAEGEIEAIKAEISEHYGTRRAALRKSSF
jgi:hypothetical protein